MSDRERKVCNQCKLNLATCEFSRRPNGSLNGRCKTCCRGALRIQKTCTICGAIFASTNQSRKRYCCCECKKVGDAIIQKEKRERAAKARLKAIELERQKNKREQLATYSLHADLPRSRDEAIRAGAPLYFTGLQCKNGHLAPKRTNNRLCVECGEERGRESYARSKTDGRYELIRAQQKHQTKKRRASDSDYREKLNSKARRWQEQNRDHLAAYMRNKRIEDPQFLIRDRLQSRLNSVLTMNGSKKSETLERYIGCTCSELVAHIESTFEAEMNWSNKGSWNIDHIRPCASFDLTDINQARLCFNWRNLTCLSTRENKSKQARYRRGDEKAWIVHMRKLGYAGDLYCIFHDV